MCSALFELHGNIAAGKAVVALIAMHGVFYNLAWSGLLIGYTVEILPYKLRAKGLMLMNVFVQAALMFNQYVDFTRELHSTPRRQGFELLLTGHRYVNPIGLANLRPRWHCYIIYCVSCIHPINSSSSLLSTH